MTTTLRSAFVTCCMLATACSSNTSNDSSAPDAATKTPDAPGLQAGTAMIPLSTPSGEDQGSFYTAVLTASGAMFTLDLDTGSTTTGIAAKTCTGCTGMSPLYTPAATATDQHKTASTQYADDSGWSGEIFADQVGLGNGSPNVMLDFVAISQQQQFFAGNEYQGILGLGPTELLENGTTSYFALVTQAGVAPILGFELCATNGKMWLGGFDASKAAMPMQYTPMLPIDDQNNPFYAVNLSDMGIGGTSLGFGSSTFQDPIVDTGTSLFYVPTVVQTALIAAVNASAGFKAVFPNQTLSADGCVNAAAGTTDAMVDQMLPQLSMSFPSGTGSATFSVSVGASESYLQDSGGGQFCLVIEGGGEDGNGTMGDTILRAFDTVIDTTSSQIGFAPDAGCEAALIDLPHARIHEMGHPPHRPHPAQ